VFSITVQLLYSQAKILIGQAAAEINTQAQSITCYEFRLFILGMFLASGISGFDPQALCAVGDCRALEASTRKELYISLRGQEPDVPPTASASQYHGDGDRRCAAGQCDDNPGILFISDIVLASAFPCS